nr:hypothetical protein [Tanacetum cinerariifolium]
MFGIAKVYKVGEGNSIPSEDPYEEAAQQLFEQVPHSPEYVPRDHAPLFVPEFEHPEDLVPAEEEAPTSFLPPGFFSPQLGLPEADTPPRNRPLLATPRPGCEVGESSATAAESSEFYTRHHDAEKDRAAMRAEIEVLRSERLAYKQEGIQTREALAKSEAYFRALEARVAVLETHAHCLEWQHQAADDFAVQHIMRTQAYRSFVFYLLISYVV